MFKLRYYLSMMIMMMAASVTISSPFSDPKFNAIDCTYNGYDLSNLTTIMGYQLTSPNQNVYYFNICGQVGECTKSSQDVSVCQKGKGGGLTNFGELDHMKFSDIADGGRGVAIEYGTTNSVCPNGNNRTTTINLRCSNVTEAVSVMDGNCLPIIEMTIVCPPEEPSKSGGIGGGWVFIIILLSVSTAYILIGSIVNWKVRHQHGSDIFPNKSFWTGFGGLIKDGVFFIRGKISGTPYHGGSYEQI